MALRLPARTQATLIRLLVQSLAGSAQGEAQPRLCSTAMVQAKVQTLAAHLGLGLAMNVAGGAIRVVEKHATKMASRFNAEVVLAASLRFGFAVASGRAAEERH